MKDLKERCGLHCELLRSAVSAPLFTGCFLRPGQISKLRLVQSWQLGEGRAALAITWDPPPSSAGRTEFYNVYRDRGLRQANFQLIGTTLTTFFNDTNIDAGLAYGYQVTAVNAFGEGALLLAAHTSSILC